MNTKNLVIKEGDVKEQLCGDYVHCSKVYSLMSGRKVVAEVIQQWTKVSDKVNGRTNSAPWFDVFVNGRVLIKSNFTIARFKTLTAAINASKRALN